MAEHVVVHGATGRRKKAVASVRLVLGVGKKSVNGRAFEEFFPVEAVRTFIEKPFELTGTVKRYDLTARVTGGGSMGQAGALRHGIARALVLADETYKEPLKAGGCLTRDPRMKERKKSGQPGARKRFQFSKR